MTGSSARAFFSVFAVLLTVAPAFADVPLSDGRDYPALTRGQVVFVNAHRLVVTAEPPPVATLPEPPPEPLVVGDTADRPVAPSRAAIWVAGHWTYGAAAGFQWVAGRYISPRPGHAFVPPRWAVLEEQHLFFNGFFVPYGVFVRSHFNRFFFSGAPARTMTAQRIDRGPYWPVGAPTRTSGTSASASARDPYWPVGAPTRANSPFQRVRTQSPFRPVGLAR